MLYVSSNNKTKQKITTTATKAREILSGWTQFGPWENNGVSPLATHFWTCGGQEGDCEQPEWV